MWQRPIKKTVFTLNVNDFAPQVTELTLPLMSAYAKKIGAEFYIIKERKHPDWPPVREKFQVAELAKEMDLDWAIFFDADALIHPETPDWTLFVGKDTVLHNGADQASIRWTYDKYFWRDGRNIGSCTWCVIASDWTIDDLWKPIDDLTYDEILERIHPTVEELNTVIKPSHLIDDFTLSRNIARYGLKFKTIIQLQTEVNLQGYFFYHIYTVTPEQKAIELKRVLKEWRIL